MSIQNDLRLMQNIVDQLDQNPVARFSYTERAFNEDAATGVASFNQNAEQNIPSVNAIDFNPAILDKGVRTQGASIPRLSLNHFFGRTSYNLNKLIQKISTFFNLHRTFLAHNANEYDDSAQYKPGDCCYYRTLSSDGIMLISWYVRISASPTTISNIAPTTTQHWSVLAMRSVTLAEESGSDALPGVADTDVSLNNTLQTMRNNLKHLFNNKVDKIAAITAVTTAAAKKIAYNSQGQITSSLNLTKSDLALDNVPNVNATDAANVKASLTDAAEQGSGNLPTTTANTAISTLLQTTRNNLKHLFNNKVDKIAAITAVTTAAAKKITYNAQGQITSSSNLTASDLALDNVENVAQCPKNAVLAAPTANSTAPAAVSTAKAVAVSSGTATNILQDIWNKLAHLFEYRFHQYTFSTSFPIGKEHYAITHPGRGSGAVCIQTVKVDLPSGSNGLITLPFPMQDAYYIALGLSGNGAALPIPVRTATTINFGAINSQSNGCSIHALIIGYKA